MDGKVNKKTANKPAFALQKRYYDQVTKFRKYCQIYTAVRALCPALHQILANGRSVSSIIDEMNTEPWHPWARWVYKRAVLRARWDETRWISRRISKLFTKMILSKIGLWFIHHSASYPFHSDLIWARDMI